MKSFPTTRKQLILLFLLGTVSLLASNTPNFLVRSIVTDNAIISLDFSPDGKWLVSGGADRTVTIWEVETGKESQTFTGHTDDVLAVRFSPNGRYVASSGVDKVIKIWDVRANELVHNLTGHSDYIRDLAFSPDGRMVASASWDMTAIVWEVSTGRQLQTFTGHSDNVTSISFNSDGTKVVTSCGDYNLRIWEVGTGKLLKVIRGHKDEIWDVKWSKNEKLIASGAWDNTARLWDMESGEELHVYPGHVTDVWSVSFNEDNTILASCGGDRKVKLWDNATGRIIADLSGDTHKADVEEVTFSPDGQLVASASRDGSIRFWKVPSMKERIAFLAEAKYAVWERRQPYEKTKDYQSRLKNKENFLNSFKQDIAKGIKGFYENTINWNEEFSLGEYEPDEEYFRLISKTFGTMKLYVPIDKAPQFAEEFNSTRFSDFDLVYADDQFTLRGVTAINDSFKKSFKAK
ncbi:MAG: WD40 repeat domain-containing protein [Bacteroidota bacterium]